MKQALLLPLIIFFTINTFSQSVTATAGSVSVVATGDDTWQNSINAVGVGDNIYTKVNNLNDQQESHQLNLSNFGIAIPNGATIDGIEVTVEWYAQHDNRVDDEHIFLIDETGSVAGNDGATNGNLTLTENQRTFGSNSDLWGLVLSESIVEDPDFGCSIVIRKRSNGGGNYDAWIDFVSITVHYTVGPENGPGSGSCLDFDGADDYVDIGDVLIDGLAEVTVEAWIYPTSLRSNSGPSGHNGNEGAIVHKSGSSDDNLGLTATSAALTFYIDNGSNNTLRGSAPLINTWTHVAATYDGNDLIIYINGVEDATMSSIGSSNIINNTNSLRIGGGHIVTHEFDGRIDEVRVWSVARSQAEIKDDMCKKLLGSEADLLAYYRFDESAGSSLVDHVSVSAGTLTNMAPASDWETSGAPIGNSSTHLYTGAWGGQQVYLQSPEGDSLGMSSIAGNPAGVHIYHVNEMANTAAGLIGYGVNEQYFGVFIAGGTTPSYTGTYYYRENDAFQLGANESGMVVSKRDDNSHSLWADAGASLNMLDKTLTMTNLHTEMFLGNSITPLPIELLGFTAHVNGGQVDLKWITSSEINNDYFTIERSSDAENWEEILQVGGAGNSSQIREYYDIDYGPLLGNSYYRLKQTDFNGELEYFNIVPVKYEEASSAEKGMIELFPSPVRIGAKANIAFSKIDEKELLVVVRDIKGRAFYSKMIMNIEEGKLIGLPIDADIPPGVYLITASSQNQLYSQKLIVK